MAYDNRDAIDLAGGKVGRLFTSLLWPTLLGMLSSIAFVITDGIFVGHGVGALGLASVNLIAPIMMLINGLGAMMGVGVGVVAAIHLSQGKQRAARINVTQAFLTVALLGVGLAAAFYAWPDAVLHLLGVSQALLAPTRQYYLWFLPTCLLLLVQTLGLYVIRLDGAPRYAMLSNVIPSLLNILFDYLLIFPCNMGLKGAALATDIGGLVGALMVIYYMLFRTRQLSFCRLKASLTSLRLSLRNVGYMMRIGFSSLVGEVAVSLMIMLGNLRFGHYLGDDGIAAYSVICYLFPVVYMIYLAIAQSAQPIISYNHGAAQPARVRRTRRIALLVAAAVGLLLQLLFTLAAPAVIAIFLDRQAAATPLATAGLPLFATGFPLCGINVCYILYLQSIERTTASTLLAIARGMLLPVLAFLLLPVLLGPQHGLWLAVPLSELASTLSIPLFARLRH